MKPQKEFTFHFRAPRSYDKASQWAQAIVTECKTMYLVTIQVLGYACPSVLEWRISKKDATTAIGALNEIAAEAYRRGNL